MFRLGLGLGLGGVGYRRRVPGHELRVTYPAAGARLACLRSGRLASGFPNHSRASDRPNVAPSSRLPLGIFPEELGVHEGPLTLTGRFR